MTTALGERLPLVLTAAVTAILGVLALVTGTGWVASSAGIGALAVASLAWRAPRASPAEDAVPEPAPAPPEPEPAVLPAASGSLDEQTVRSLFRSRVALARRTLQPLSIIHLMVSKTGPDGPTSVALAEVLDATLRESDVYGQRDDGVYVFVLAETGEDGAVWTAERIRRRLAADPGDRLFCAGIACYPAHGFDADELEVKAAAALVAAREWKRDRIEVATASSSSP